KNRLKHEEMKWLSQPRRISPLIRTFLSIKDHNEAMLAFEHSQELRNSNGLRSIRGKNDGRYQ
ncbi:hypothetical protein, partial [Enterobacter hormaechei]